MQPAVPVAALAVLVAFYFLYSPLAPSPTYLRPDASTVPAPPSSDWTGEPAQYQVVGQVPKIKWTRDRPFIELLTKSSVPIVLTNTAVNDWPALQPGKNHWSLDYIAQKAGSRDLKNVFAHHQPLFGPYFTDTRPMNALSATKWKNANSFVNMTMLELIDRLKSSKGVNEESTAKKETREQREEREKREGKEKKEGREEKKSKHSEAKKKPADEHAFVYFTDHMRNVPELRSDVSPMEILEIDPTSEVSNVNFWIGQSGTTSDTHYDSYENFYVQILGRKKWVIFHPWYDDSLHLYPFIHPSHAQCQASIDLPEHELRADVSRLRAVTVTIEPGDMLYLPPLWFHHVEAQGEPSVAVNAWSYTLQSDIKAKALEQTTPLLMASQFVGDRMALASCLFMSDVLHHLSVMETEELAREREEFSEGWDSQAERLARSQKNGRKDEEEMLVQLTQSIREMKRLTRPSLDQYAKGEGKFHRDGSKQDSLFFLRSLLQNRFSILLQKAELRATTAEERQAVWPQWIVQEDRTKTEATKKKASSEPAESKSTKSKKKQQEANVRKEMATFEKSYRNEETGRPEKIGAFITAQTLFGIPSDTRHIWVGNWVEWLATMSIDAVQVDLNLLPAYLQQCVDSLVVDESA